MGTESNKPFIFAHSEAASKILTQNQNSLGINISQRQISVENVRSFTLEELIKTFKFTSSPKRRAYLSFSYFSTFQRFSLHVLHFVAIWFYFFSILMARLLFIFCSSASRFLSLWSNLYFVVHSM